MSSSYEFAACPACASEAAVEVASREEIRREMEALWAFHLRRLRPGTPPEHLSDRLAFTQDPPLRVARCRGCGALYRSPQERPAAVVARYAEEPLDTDVLRGLLEAQRPEAEQQLRRLERVAGKGGEGIELGSYAGAFLDASRRNGWRFTGLDVNSTAIDFLREQGYEVEQGTLQETASSRRYDAVAVWNCLDQLPDPRGTIRAARVLLKPEGVLALRVPNGAFYARWRARLRGPLRSLATAFLAHNNLLGFPYRTGFTPDSLVRLLRENGFEVVDAAGDVLLPTADRWTRSWAVWEERGAKALLRGVTGWRRAPWFELYARPVG